MGWPTRMPAKGLAESVSALVNTAQLLELGGGQQVGVVDHEDDAAVALGLLGRQQRRGLGHDLGLAESGMAAEGADDGDVEAPSAKGRVGHVDDVVRRGVEARHRRSNCNRFPGTHVADENT